MATRKKRIGSVRWRKDVGAYFIDYYDNLGKRHRELIGTNLHEANDKLNEKMGQSNDGTSDASVVEILFKGFAETWFERKVDIKEATQTSYRGILDNHLIPYFGNGRVSEITKANIKDFVKDKHRKGKLSPKTFRNILVTLHQILDEAEDDGLIENNPYPKKTNAPKCEKPETDYLQKREIAVFLEKCEPKTYPIFYTAIFTGMRRGELLGLKWGDVDWVNNQIHVRRSLYKGKLQSPKSKYSVRTIDMGSRLVKVLKDHRVKQNEHRLKMGSKWVDNDLVFCQDDGSFLDGDNLYHRDFQRTLKKAGLRHMRIHDLRHTFASILIAAGHHPKYIQNQMGHGSIQITMDLYGHMMKEVHEGAAEKSESFVFGHGMGTEQEKGVTAEAATP
jgi:integrase